jgi:hypothetical protein
VKGLAEAMGGSALARPSTLGGLEVVVRLRVEQEPEAEPEVDTTSVEHAGAEAT